MTSQQVMAKRHLFAHAMAILGAVQLLPAKINMKMLENHG